MNKIFIFGSRNGQLYWELARTVPTAVECISWPERLDICDANAVNDAVKDMRPDVIINTAAYTAVDKAESCAEEAFAVNQFAVENIARAANQIKAHVIHVSTDFVFGCGDGSPFNTDASTNPINVYGKSKLAGELLLAKHMPDRHTLVRTSWLYSSNGSNFVKTMLRLMKEQDKLGVVCDQIGAPTWARSLAFAIWKITCTRKAGTLHWTGAGVASWYDFAMAIYEQAMAMGIIDKNVAIHPITSEQYPTPASRPHYSVLACQCSCVELGLQARHWKADLHDMLKELRSEIAS